MMSKHTVAQFSSELKMPAQILLDQLRAAGVDVTSVNDVVTNSDKAKLLESLRRAHGGTEGKKVTLTRRQTSEVHRTDHKGSTRTIPIEVRKKRVFVKRTTEGSAAPITTVSGITDVALENLDPQATSITPKATRWNKLSSISIKNFKAIESLSLPLADVTVMVGPNGSGKSSVLQAIHWAARAASYIPPKKQAEVVDFERLDYSPSSEPLKTAHKSSLTADRGSPPTEVSFVHMAEDDSEPAVATVRIWAARFGSGISVHIEGGSAVTPFKQREEVITSYIPGLAGLSEKETILVQPLLRRQAASGDAGGVLRNVLFNIASRRPGEADNTAAEARSSRLNTLIQMVHPNVQLEVSFNDREDINIQALYDDAVLAGVKRPLETAATGVLQVVQIFAYLILFRPKLLLIDEPDAHLHPDKQERLIEALEHAAGEFDVQIILTTHSPHIARAASPSANLIWVRNGIASNQEDEAIRTLLGWGGLDKRLLFFVEDENDQPIRQILRQWPQINRQVAVCRCFGIDNLPRSAMLKGLFEENNFGVRALVHRDRDYLTDTEVQKWSERYVSVGTMTWVTTHVDVEAYFCQPAYLSALYGVELDVAKSWIEEAITLVDSRKKVFFEKRKVINRVLYENGGSPASEQLWNELEVTPEKSVLGKKLHAALKTIVKAHRHDDRRLDKFVVPTHYVMAPELKDLLSTVLNGN